MDQVSTTIDVNEYPAGKHYVARDAGPDVEFYDGGDLIFTVPAAAAGSQTARDALAKVYDIGKSDGHINGRVAMQCDFRRLLNLS